MHLQTKEEEEEEVEEDIRAYHLPCSRSGP
jgi:hypothetical protein